MIGGVIERVDAGAGRDGCSHCGELGHDGTFAGVIGG